MALQVSMGFQAVPVVLHSSTALALQRFTLGVQPPVHKPIAQDTAQVVECSHAVPVLLQICTEFIGPQR